jgi:hypothetical protein
MSAMCDLSLLCGIDTVSWNAELALRSLVSMSATGSVIVIGVLPFWPGFDTLFEDADLWSRPRPTELPALVYCGEA